MQYKPTQYDPRDHDSIKALTVKQPYATNLVTSAYVDESGTRFGVKSIELRSYKTKFRGDILICSSQKPVIYGMDSGVMVGYVEMYDIKKASDFTPYDWECTGIPEKDREPYKKYYGWMMRNPRRVVEFEVTGQLGIFNLIYTKDTVMLYPEKLVVDKKDYLLITGKKI